MNMKNSQLLDKIALWGGVGFLGYALSSKESYAQEISSDEISWCR